MKAFRPSANFVSRVMENVHAFEDRKQRRARSAGSLLCFWPLRWAMSAGSIFCWLLLSPTICI
jgi:hypothetical protein